MDTNRSDRERPIPAQITGDVDDDAYHSLAVRDLQRGQAIGLPSGEAIARLIGAEILDPADIGLARHGWRGETPLWFYILREADVAGDGDRLGPVGGRIVGEVLIGLLNADPESFRSADPGWSPTLPAASPGHYSLADLLADTIPRTPRQQPEGHERLHASGLDRPDRDPLEHRRLLRVPTHRRLVGAPPRVHDVRRGRLLRQLAEQARDGALPRDRAPDHPLARARRGLVLVLRRRGRFRARRRLTVYRREVNRTAAVTSSRATAIAQTSVERKNPKRCEASPTPIAGTERPR